MRNYRTGGLSNAKSTLGRPQSTQKGYKILGLILSFLIIFIIFLLMFLSDVLDSNASWRKNAEIVANIEVALSNFGHRIEEDVILDSPYIVIFLEGSYSGADIEDAVIWKKPFSSLSDENISKIKTFVIVFNKSADHASYTDGSSVTTYNAYINYINSDGEYLGQEYIAAEPLSKKKSYGNGGQVNYMVSKSRIMRAVKKHIN